jgi:prepilin-type N-terminal cleavage/methylation domain-containing protein
MHRLTRAIILRNGSCARSGFSLVELLTVIAIIAILAAVIFPVMGSVREKARQSSCMSNLHNIWLALRMYKQDERQMPVSIGPFMAKGSSAEISPLFPEYLKNKSALHCPNNDEGDANTYEPLARVQRWVASPSDIAAQGVTNDPVLLGASFSQANSYDGYLTPNGYELRYSRYRTLNPSDPDYSRQLALRNPPDDTVITWCSYHRRRSPSGPAGDDLVLFMSGEVERHPAAEMEKLGWRVKPRG